MRKSKPLRVIVCGATFGMVYLKSLAQLSVEFELVGLLAKGSDNASRCAQEYNIPLFTSVESLPQDIDVACVVIRSTCIGGMGTDLALSLLARGIHVIQEYPVHHDDIVCCLKSARKNGVQYRINSFYADLQPVRNFIQAAKESLRRSQPVYMDVMCGINILYPMVDILGQIFDGFRPWSFAKSFAPTVPEPLTTLSGTFAGVPIRLGIQNSMDPRDPDNSGLLFHRFVLCTENGTLMLPDTYGPVLWTPRMYVPPSDDGVRYMYQDSPQSDLGIVQIQEPVFEKSFRDVYTEVWINAMNRCLSRFAQSIKLCVDDKQLDQYCLTACRVWQDIGQHLGIASELEINPPAVETLGGSGEGL